MEFKTYWRKQITAELADWEPDMDLTGVSISDVDKRNGSPKAGADQPFELVPDFLPRGSLKPEW